MKPKLRDDSVEPARRQLAEAVRAACFRAALESYEQARLDGLCHEGAWEVALDAIRSLDIEAIVADDETGFQPHR